MKSIIFIIAVILGIASVGLLVLVILDVLVYNDLQEKLTKEKEKDARDDARGD